MRQFAIIATISGFDKKKSYGSLGLSKSIKKQSVQAVETKQVNRCINTSVKRKKHSVDAELNMAKKEFKAANKGKKPVLLVSSKLN